MKHENLVPSDGLREVQEVGIVTPAGSKVDFSVVR